MTKKKQILTSTKNEDKDPERRRLKTVFKLILINSQDLNNLN